MEDNFARFVLIFAGFVLLSLFLSAWSAKILKNPTSDDRLKPAPPALGGSVGESKAGASGAGRNQDAGQDPG